MTARNAPFLKSINLRQDHDHPERLAHFHPTQKSVRVLRTIMNAEPSAATMIVAAFGSGKSISAGAAALFVENSKKSRAVLDKIVDRLRSVDGELHDALRERLNSRAKGLVLLCEGHQSELGATLCEAAKEQLPNFRRPHGGNKNVVKSLNAIHERARQAGCDRIAIIWDEFGRHLEALTTSGHAEELSVVQQIAEWASRQASPHVTFNILLHHSFFQYAGNLSQVARNSWRKIEGRFSTLRYVEDSQEIYGVIASVIEDAKPKLKAPGQAAFRKIAEEARESGLFEGFQSVEALHRVLAQAYPLDCTALHMLPRLSARLAQNERSVFAFLKDTDWSKPVGMPELYAYFSEAMEADVGIGGTHRRWLETESALSKAHDDHEREAICAASLLSLGVSGERVRVKKKTLAFALQRPGSRERRRWDETIDRLIDRRLLLYRERNDDVSVWHGTDVDVRAFIEEERLRINADLDPTELLEKEHPAPSWRPVIHNVRNRIRRFFEGRYLKATDLLAQQRPEELVLRPGVDGRVIYCLPDRIEEVNAARRAAIRATSDEPGLVVVVPDRPLPIIDIVIEIVALRQLQRNGDLIGSDPYVLPEIQHLIDAAQESLARVLNRLVSPSSGGSTWIANGEAIRCASESDLRVLISCLADARFPKTPQLNNELIVRHTISRPMVNARKKLILSILERTGEAHLGLDPSMTTPDVALYRTLIAETGLYGERGHVWRWAKPGSLRDEGLRAVWERIEAFFTEAGERKNPAVLFDELTSPPFGMRQATLPILFAAGLTGFAKAVVIRSDGQYVKDILASELEDMCARPERYSIDVLLMDDKRARYLRQLIEQFGGAVPLHGDLMRHLYDAVELWKSQLPASALRSRSVSADAQDFQTILRRLDDPAEMAFGDFPKLAGTTDVGQPTLKLIAAVGRELESIIEGYVGQAVRVIAKRLCVSADTGKGVLEHASDWAACFSEAATRDEGLDHSARALLSRAADAATGRYTEASFARAVSTMLLGKGLDRWDDTTITQFDASLRTMVGRIEHAVLEGDEVNASAAPILKQRISQLIGQLERAVGPEQAADILAPLAPRAATRSQIRRPKKGKSA